MATTGAAAAGVGFWLAGQVIGVVRMDSDAVALEFVVERALGQASVAGAGLDDVPAGTSGMFQLVSRGVTSRAIATRLRIGEATVKTHLLHVYGKLGVSDRASAVNAAWQRGLVQAGPGPKRR